MKQVKVGLIGCGNISSTYLATAKKFESFKIVGCADLDISRTKGRAKEFGLKAYRTPELLLADPKIEVVLNLTNPASHYEVAMSALKAGKNVHGEKPMAVKLADGKKMLDTACAKGLLIGGAPDTFMGAGLQTCRKLIDDGAIGAPVGATAFMLCSGHEAWHPDPEFYYLTGGGPLFDMGPYYMTALVNLLGPVRRVAGAARITNKQRVIKSEKKRGQMMKVEVPTHVTGLLEFASGPLATVTLSFDVCASFGKSDITNQPGANQVPFVEIYGTEGSLTVPDPNCFGGPVYLTKEGKHRKVKLTHGYADENRSIGLADLAYALRSGRPNRCNGEMTYHVLEIMHALHSSSKEGRHIELSSSCRRPAPLPTGLAEGKLDE